MPWKKTSSNEVYRNKWMHVTEDEVETDAGKKLTYGVVHKEPFALIVPWDGERFILVGQYRYIVDAFSWEFPQGHFEHANIEETAREELREETGLTAKNVEAVGSFWIGPGAITQVCCVFLATGLEQGPRDLEESEEDMEVKRVTPEELVAMMNDGSLRDGATMAALTLLRATGKLA